MERFYVNDRPFYKGQQVMVSARYKDGTYMVEWWDKEGKYHTPIVSGDELSVEDNTMQTLREEIAELRREIAELKAIIQEIIPKKD